MEMKAAVCRKAHEPLTIETVEAFRALQRARVAYVGQIRRAT